MENSEITLLAKKWDGIGILTDRMEIDTSSNITSEEFFIEKFSNTL